MEQIECDIVPKREPVEIPEFLEVSCVPADVTAEGNAREENSVVSSSTNFDEESIVEIEPNFETSIDNDDDLDYHSDETDISQPNFNLRKSDEEKSETFVVHVEQAIATDEQPDETMSFDIQVLKPDGTLASAQNSEIPLALTNPQKPLYIIPVENLTPKTINPKLENSCLPIVSSVQIPRVSNIQIPRVSNGQVRQKSNVPIAPLSKLPIPKLSKVAIPKVSKVAIPKVSKVQVPLVSNVPIHVASIPTVVSLFEGSTIQNTVDLSVNDHSHLSKCTDVNRLQQKVERLTKQNAMLRKRLKTSQQKTRRLSDKLFKLQAKFYCREEDDDSISDFS